MHRHISLLVTLSHIHLPYTGDCLGPGFTTTIPTPGQRPQYSTTVLGPGDGAIYTAFNFTCRGTLESLTIPSEFRGNDHLYWDRFLYAWPSIWRFNGTGYHKVREFQLWKGPFCNYNRCHRTLKSDELFQYSDTIQTKIDVLANDMLGFQMKEQDRFVYQHLPLLYKPGPSPGTFIPIVSANFTASSVPITSECKGLHATLHVITGLQSKEV